MSCRMIGVVAMISTWSIFLDAFPVLAMAAAIMFIPLVGDFGLGERPFSDEDRN
jgi:hypothetical protein